MFVGKTIRAFRSVAAWTSLAGAITLGAWFYVDATSRQPSPAYIRTTWLALALLVAGGPGLLAVPRWQGLVGVAATVVAVLLLLR